MRQTKIWIIAIVALFFFRDHLWASDDILKSTTQTISSETRLVLEQINFLREDMNILREDMNTLREDMNTLREDMNKRFEQVDKRFEQVDKRFEFIQNLLITLLGIIIGGVFYSIIRDRKIPKDMDQFIDRLRKTELMIKEMLTKDPDLMEHFKKIGLL